jgi:hypothetical protein
VNASALRQSFRSRRDLTPRILLRPSRERRPSQSKRRSAIEAESIDNFRLALRPRGPLPPRKKGRCNRCSSVLFFQGFPVAPSVFALASALTSRRSLPGPRRGRRRKGRTPFVEPEPRFR